MLVAGVDFSGAKTVPNDTWLVTGELSSLGLKILSVKNTGSHALAHEIDQLKELSVCGFDFPFSFPIEFLRFLARKLDRDEFQEWQEVAETMVFMDFDRLKQYVDEYEIVAPRFADTQSARTAKSPLHQVNPSMVPMTFYGIRFLAMLNPDRYIVLPFQTDKKKNAASLIEVYPRELLYLFGLPDQGYKAKDKKNRDKAQALKKDIVDGLIHLRERGDKKYEDCPRLHIDNSLKGAIIASDHAVDALVACCGAALFHSKPALFPDPLASNNDNVLLEGWIYGPRKLAAAL